MKVAAAALWPLSLSYGAGARLRAWAYSTRIFQIQHLPGVVVSVGNITTGGTGKTPMTAWVAQRFLDSGRKTAVLARGYRPLESAAASRESGTAGWNDEIALLRARLGEQIQFGIGANRFETGSQLASRGVQCFVLDDGFQHQQLARDVDLVMIDAANPFGCEQLLPMGHLREPLCALRRAEMIVIHRAESAPKIEAGIRKCSAAPIFYSQTKLLSVEAFGEAAINAAPVLRQNYFAFCGIGNPAAFLADLKKWDFSVAGHEFFRDHHRYTPADMSLLSKSAAQSGAEALICTEKDSFDLPLNAPMRMPIFFCRIALQFTDEEGLWRAISEIIGQKTRGCVP